jgi:uncharacterized membrane protein
MEGNSRVRNANIEHQESLSLLERFALLVTEKIGSMGFFFMLFCITLVWILWNSYAPQEIRFDPFPAFVLWLFISNILQLLFMPLLMIGQNLQARHSEVRAEADYELNVVAEKEIQRILRHLDKQEKLSMEILRRIDDQSR